MFGSTGKVIKNALKVGGPTALARLLIDDGGLAREVTDQAIRQAKSTIGGAKILPYLASCALLALRSLPTCSG